LQREEAAAASSTEMSGVVERRCRSGAGRRWSFFSVPWVGGEAQGAEEQRKKKTVWGKKERFTPTALFIYGRVGVVGVEVLHYPDRFCSKSPRGGMKWAAVTVTVPLGHDGRE
jgi:hypothetical protein